MLDDTIVAVATAEGQGGLAVVRLSGPAALLIARRIVGEGALAEPVVSHRARLAVLHWPRDGAPFGAFAGAVAPGQELDQALVLPLLSPHGYTGEDTVEFSCHGGRLPARLVAAACEAAGARAAGPGEFTRRAFLNGKLSLAEAEAVADLIQAEHAVGVRAALAQLRGGLEREIASLVEPLRGATGVDRRRDGVRRRGGHRAVRARDRGGRRRGSRDAATSLPRSPARDDACATACRWCSPGRRTPARAACSTRCSARTACSWTPRPAPRATSCRRASSAAGCSTCCTTPRVCARTAAASNDSACSAPSRRWRGRRRPASVGGRR